MANIIGALSGAGNVLNDTDKIQAENILRALANQQNQNSLGAMNTPLSSILNGAGGFPSSDAGSAAPSAPITPPNPQGQPQITPSPGQAMPPMQQTANAMNALPAMAQGGAPSNKPPAPPQQQLQGPNPTLPQQSQSMSSPKLSLETVLQAIIKKNPNVTVGQAMAMVGQFKPLLDDRSQVELQKAQMAMYSRMYAADQGRGGRDDTANAGITRQGMGDATKLKISQLVTQGKLDQQDLRNLGMEDVAQTNAGSRKDVAGINATSREKAALIRANAASTKLINLAGKMTDAQKAKARNLTNELNQAEGEVKVLLANPSSGEDLGTALRRRDNARKNIEDFTISVEPTDSAPIGKTPPGKVMTFNPETGNIE